MELKEVFQALKAGKKVIANSNTGGGDAILHKDGDNIINEKGCEFYFMGWFIDDKTTFEIVEEKKTLYSTLYTSQSQYLKEGGNLDKMIVCSLYKLKGTIKELMEYLLELDVDKGRVINKARDIFGEELI